MSSRLGEQPRGRVLYDADCGFCERSVRIVRALPIDVDSVALQSVDLDAHGINLADALTAMPFVDTDGTVTYGHLAWARLLRHGRGPLPLVGRALGSRGIEPVARRVYAWVAANRYRFPGSSPACSLPPRPAPPTQEG